MYREVFNKAGDKPEGSERMDFLEAILRERPDLRGIKPEYPAEGMKGYVIIIGNEVFKAPKSINPASEAFHDYNTELEYLTALQGKEGVSVPEITTIGKDFHFFGMTKIDGERLPKNLSAEERDTFVKELIDFVVNLANILPTRNGKFASHDDLYHANLVADPETKHLNGVIDFGKIRYISPDEWRPMYDFYATGAYQELLNEFNRRRDELPGAAPKGPVAKIKNALRMTTNI